MAFLERRRLAACTRVVESVFKKVGSCDTATSRMPTLTALKLHVTRQPRSRGVERDTAMTQRPAQLVMAQRRSAARPSLPTCTPLPSNAVTQHRSINHERRVVLRAVGRHTPGPH